MKKIAIIVCSIICLTASIIPMHAQESIHIASDYAILINLKDNQVLFEKNSEKRMFPASMTKVMTVLTAMDHLLDLQAKLTITADMLEGLKEEGASIVGFVVNEEVTIQDLLYGALLPSGADACRALAFYVSGSETDFVNLMNQKAVDLNLTNTHFVNTTGLHNDDHYTTAKEMAEITKVAIQNQTILDVMSSDTYTTSANAIQTSGRQLTSTLRKQEINANLNTQLIKGGKTGFTLEGGLCLASISSLDNESYLLVSGSAGDDVSSYQHIRDAHAIYEYMYATYDYKMILPEGTTIATIKLQYNFSHRSLDVKATEDLSATINETYDMSKVHVIFEGPTQMEAPIEQDQLLGTIKVIYDENEVLKEIPYYANETIERNWLLYGFSIMLDFIVSIRYIFLSILVLLVIWIGYRRHKVLQRRKKRKQQRRT